MKIAIRSGDGKTIAGSLTSFSGYLVYELDKDRVVNTEFRRCTPSHADDIKYIGDCETIMLKSVSADEKELLHKIGKQVLITFKTSPDEAIRSYMKQKYLHHSFVH